MDAAVKLRAIEANIADCHAMIRKAQEQVDGFRALEPSRSMPQKKIDKRIALFLREVQSWETRLAKWEARRQSVVGP